MDLKGKGVLLTGGSGFLGRVLIKKLVNRGAAVFAPRSADMDLLNIVDTKVTFRCNRPDVVIHCAAYYGGLGINYAYPADIFYKNTIMYANILEVSRRFNVKKIVMVGTGCSYPDGLNILKEKDLWSGPTHKSVQNYGGVKRMMQIGIESYKSQYNMDGIHVILTNLYGEWDSYNPERSHVVAALIRKFVEAKIKGDDVEVWGTGKPIREFLYIKDAAEGIVRAVEAYEDIEPLNIGTGIGTSVRGLVNAIAEIVEFPKDRIFWQEDKPDGQYKKVFDVTKMRDSLQWGPPTSLVEGLRKTISWFEDNYDQAIERW